MEIWKPVSGYEGLYEVSGCGKVKSLLHNQEKILKPNFQEKGYLSVELYKEKKRKRFLIHRIVAEAFIPNIENKPQVNHIDENKSNNSVENLEWVTEKQNINHGTRTKRQIEHTDYTTQKRKEIAYANSQKACIPVIQFNKNGNKIKEFNSASSAKRVLNINASHISETCKGKRQSAGGFVWAYKKGGDDLSVSL